MHTFLLEHGWLWDRYTIRETVGLYCSPKKAGNKCKYNILLANFRFSFKSWLLSKYSEMILQPSVLSMSFYNWWLLSLHSQSNFRRNRGNLEFQPKVNTKFSLKSNVCMLRALSNCCIKHKFGLHLYRHLFSGNNFTISSAKWNDCTVSVTDGLIMNDSFEEHLWIVTT